MLSCSCGAKDGNQGLGNVPSLLTPRELPLQGSPPSLFFCLLIFFFICVVAVCWAALRLTLGQAGLHSQSARQPPTH